MKKIGKVLCLKILFSALMLSVAGAQPEEILINNVEGYKRKQRPPVTFPHEIHMAGDLSCTACHHQYQNGQNVLDESELEEGDPGIRCAHCHTQMTRIKLRQAFHRQCVGCHAKTEKGGEKTGPRLCGECHRRTQ